MNNGTLQLPPKLADRIEKTQREQELQDEAGIQAASQPLPGLAKSAFSPETEMAVGILSVRSLCDADFEYLSWLGHPLAKTGLSQVVKMKNVEELEKAFDAIKQELIPSGPNFWAACWILTRSVEDCDAAFQKVKTDGVKSQARIQFGKMNAAELVKLAEAVYTQYSRYWSMVVGHGAPEHGENGEARPPDPSDSRSGPLKTATAG